MMSYRLLENVLPIEIESDVNNVSERFLENPIPLSILSLLNALSDKVRTNVVLGVI